MSVDLTVRRTRDVLDDLIAASADSNPKTAANWCYIVWESDVGDRVSTILAGSPDDPQAAILADEHLADVAWSEAHERCCSETASINEDLYYQVSNALRRAVQFDEDARPDWVEQTTWDPLLSELHTITSDHDLWDAIEKSTYENGPLEDTLDDEANRRHVKECKRGSIDDTFHSIP